jgi:hypothetical protein
MRQPQMVFSPKTLQITQQIYPNPAKNQPKPNQKRINPTKTLP